MLSPSFLHCKMESKKLGDNGDRKNDPEPERANNKVLYKMTTHVVAFYIQYQLILIETFVLST